MTTQQPHEFNTGTRCRVSGCNRYQRYNGQPDPEPAPPPPVDLITGPDARYCLDCHQTSLPQRTTCYFCNSARLVPAIKTPCPCCGISQLKPRY
jgi:hypothetical protein